MIADLRAIKRAYEVGLLVNPESICSVCKSRPISLNSGVWRCKPCADEARNVRADLMQRVG